MFEIFMHFAKESVKYEARRMQIEAQKIKINYGREGTTN